jgi:Xaa-Pro aminopeptidase
MVKEPEEVERLREAAKVAEAGMEAAVGAVDRGVTQSGR